MAALSEGFGIDSGECFHKECFKCEKCRIIITDGNFAMEGTSVYHPRCRSLAMGDVCRTCSKIIEDAILTYKGTKFHSDCFTCATCTKPLSGKPFSDIDGKLMCGPCSTAYQLEKATLQKEKSAAEALAAQPASEAKVLVTTTAQAPAVVQDVKSSPGTSGSGSVAEGDNGVPVACDKCRKSLNPHVSLSFFLF